MIEVLENYAIKKDQTTSKTELDETVVDDNEANEQIDVLKELNDVKKVAEMGIKSPIKSARNRKTPNRKKFNDNLLSTSTSTSTASSSVTLAAEKMMQELENMTMCDETSIDDDAYDDDETNLKLFQSSRSKTMPASILSKSLKDSGIGQSCHNLNITFKNINMDRFKTAKEEAERAIKDKKIFTIIGPYPALRNALRRRGWIEKFENMNPSWRKSKSNASKKIANKSNSTAHLDESQLDASTNMADDNNDDTDEEDEEDKMKPWEENNGYYGILSRLVKNFASSFIWTVRSNSIDYCYLNKDQFVNHFNKNGAFTTKIGLCSNLRNLPWHCPQISEEFFPRCYKLCQDEDRTAFIDDYRLTACIGLLKYYLIKYRGETDDDFLDVHITSAEEVSKMNQASSVETSPELSDQSKEPQNSSRKDQKTTLNKSNSKSISIVPVDAIEFAIEQIEKYIDFKEDNDLDRTELNYVPDESWTKLFEWFYAACHDKKPFQQTSESLTHEATRTLENVQKYWPQYSIDGYRNIWIVKPGALSRGRGIMLFDKLENMLELNRGPLQKEGKYVVQKYIERPLLIHKIKFDIRQWFLVTDFNPLTIWMYKDCYLRFCTQQFTLDTTQQSVHLCNYSIQKYYKNDAERSAELPDENMWSSGEFIDKYLSKMNSTQAWNDLIYPGMKNAILSSMLSSQDIIEARKNSFELYGADFMLGEDLKPWLIEINCSPTMARSTEVTKILCDSVLEDVCKVIIDRKYNRNADTGRFELIYKASPVTVPNYVGIDLKIDGFSYRKAQQQLSPQSSLNQTSTTTTTTTLQPPMLNKSQSQFQQAQRTQTPLTPPLQVHAQPLQQVHSSPPKLTSNTLHPVESISVTNLDFKVNRNVPPKQPRSFLSSSMATTSLRKETTLPTISLTSANLKDISKKEPNLTSLMNFYKTIEAQTNYLLNYSNEMKKNADTDMNNNNNNNNANKLGRKEKKLINNVYSINEPKLIQFNQFNLPVTKINIQKPYANLFKRSSISYHQFIKFSKAKEEQNSKQSEFALKIKKSKRPKRKELVNLNKLEVSDLNTIEFDHNTDPPAATTTKFDN